MQLEHYVQQDCRSKVRGQRTDQIVVLSVIPEQLDSVGDVMASILVYLAAVTNDHNLVA